MRTATAGFQARGYRDARAGERRERDLDEPERDLDEPARDLDELCLDPFEELRRELDVLLELRLVLRRRPFDRWSLGTSARTTARVS